MNDIVALNSLKKLSLSPKHCAFTDLIQNPFNAEKLSFLCCYREASDHVSLDGVICIQAFSASLEGVVQTTLSMKDTDLRDPKFVFDGSQLVITAFAKRATGQTYIKKMVSFTSTNGKDWSGPVTFCEQEYWIWRTTWHRDTAYGFGYYRAQEKLNLYHGDPKTTMNLLTENALSLETHQVGYPNESHILFDASDNATAIVRRDADSYSAKLGRSCPPYTDWEWRDLGIYIGGPVMEPLTENFYLVAGRDWDEKNNNKLTTKLWLLNTNEVSLRELLTLPSAGDTSYPGISVIDDTIYLSYYSSHEEGETSVYFAEISGVYSLLNIVKQT